MLLYEAANEINLEEERLTYEAQEKYYSDAIDDAEVSISIYLSIYLRVQRTYFIPYLLSI